MSAAILQFPIARPAVHLEPTARRDEIADMVDLARALTPTLFVDKPAARRRQAGHAWKPDHKGNNPLRAGVEDVSVAVTIVGKVIHRRHGFDPATLRDAVRLDWIEGLREGAEHARRIADQCDEAIVRLQHLQ